MESSPDFTLGSFSPTHPGFYLISPSEFERFSLSARNITEPLCSLDISWSHGAAHARCVEVCEAFDQGCCLPTPRSCMVQGWPSLVSALSSPRSQEWDGRGLVL